MMRPTTCLFHILLFGGSMAFTVHAQLAIRCIEPDAQSGTSAAVSVGNLPLAHTAQMLPLDKSGALIGKGDVSIQSAKVLSNIAAVLTAANSDLAVTVKLNVYLSRSDSMPLVQRAIASRFKPPIMPAVSFVVTGLPEADALVAMDATAVARTSRSDQMKTAPVYSENGVQHFRVLPVGPTYYVSGMADTNALPAATLKTLEKLVAAIGNLGLQKKDIVQLKAFLQPISDVAVVRKQIVEFFGDNAPPISFVEWVSPPPNPPIEIELIAGGGGDFRKEPEAVSFLTPPGTTSTKVFSRVARVNHGNLIYVSGLYGWKAQDAEGQVREIFGSLGEILKQANGDFENLVKATYYVSDNAASDKLNDIRPEFFNPQRPPAASKAKVKDVGPKGKTVTFDMIAVEKPK
jgi:enamine deaminase RidA (YjgF/YER057c/UK114 family)